MQKENYHDYIQEIWTPSFEFANIALDILFDKFEWALREKDLEKSIQPFGINCSVSVLD